VQWYKEASTLKQQTILRDLLAKLEKQFTETTKLDGMIRENMRGLGYNINTWDII
jgi:hypothetical protein